MKVDEQHPGRTRVKLWCILHVIELNAIDTHNES
jgi:hypothetical protein